jgi:hypothetical protein
MKYLDTILIVLTLVVFYATFFYAVFEMKFEYIKKEKMLILWYTEYQSDGSIKRRYIKLWKSKKPTKP